MASKTALVTGGTGLLGRQVVRAFEKANWTVKGTGLSRADGVTIFKVDLLDSAQVEKAMDDTNPDVVVHCAANRYPDKVDKDPEGTRALNIEATKSLAKLCSARKVPLIYISTDYVFPGTPGDAPYEADATPKPTNLYGQTKLDGEKVVLEEYSLAGLEGLGIVLRVPVLYGEAETPAESAVNVLMDSLWKAQKGGAKIKMDHWAIRYPTNTEDVARVCVAAKDPHQNAYMTADISRKYLEAGDSRAELPKILQFSSEDRMTKYDICQKFGEIMGLPLDGIEANTEGNDPNATVQRPYDCHLSTKTLKELGISVWTQDFTAWWRREVRAFRK